MHIDTLIDRKIIWTVSFVFCAHPSARASPRFFACSGSIVFVKHPLKLNKILFYSYHYLYFVHSYRAHLSLIAPLPYKQATNLLLAGMPLTLSLSPAVGPRVCSSRQFYHWQTARTQPVACPWLPPYCRWCCHRRHPQRVNNGLRVG